MNAVIMLCLIQTLESRDVTHMQFTGWPDYGVPHSAAAFLDFMFAVRQKQEQRVLEASGSDQTDACAAGPPPVVIHCSAGIGRTGSDSFIVYLLATSVLCCLVPPFARPIPSL